MSIATGGTAQPLNMDLFSAANLATGVVVARTANSLVYDMQGGLDRVELSGVFAYSTAGAVTGGTITGIRELIAGTEVYRIGGLGVSAPAFFQAVNAGNDAAARALVFTGADSITGTLFGDTLRAYGQGDYLFGLGGDDLLYSGPGADFLDGGAGDDTAIFSGARSNYVWYASGDASWVIYDRRSGTPDGAFDNLKSVETLRFSDQAVSPGTPGVSAALLGPIGAVLREAPPGNAAFATTLANYSTGQITSAAAIQQFIQQADATTSVATLSYQFFTGRTPSAAGLNYLVSTSGGNGNSLDSPYYQSFNVENRYINFAVNLGKNGEGRASFEATYGSKSLFEATRTAYAAIFGPTPGDTKVHALLDDRADYFAYYGQDGGQGLGTKAAMVGWLLAEAAKADVGLYDTANRAYLADLAGGASKYAVNLMTDYHGVPFTG